MSFFLFLVITIPRAVFQTEARLGRRLLDFTPSHFNVAKIPMPSLFQELVTVFLLCNGKIKMKP